MGTSLPPPPPNPQDPTPMEQQRIVRVTSHRGAQMGGGGLLGANSLVTKPPREEKNLCQLAHSPAPRLHLEPNTAGRWGHHQTCLTDLTKTLPSGSRKPRESRPCSQVSGVACKYPPKAWPWETLLSAPFLGRPYWS